MLRRDLLGGLAASTAFCALPITAAQAASTARREFRIMRDGSDIGRHLLVARRGPDGFEIDIDIEIVVRVLGIAAYRYELRNRETWAGGKLMKLDSETNDDGDRYFARVRRAGDALEVEGTSYRGAAAPIAATTSYFVPDFLERPVWISTQSGAPLSVKVSPTGGTRWTVSGELETTLIYDDRGEWMGSEFDAGGELGTYELIEETGLIAPLWRAA